MPKNKLCVAMYSPDTGTQPTELPLDYQERVKLIRSALDAANKVLVAQNAPDVLPIFVGPEWMFRRAKNGKENNPFTQAEKDSTIKLLAALSETFSNWLIIPGSIIWGYASPDKASSLPTPPKVFNWFNTVPVLYQGKLLHTYHKQHNADGSGTTYDKMPIVHSALASSSGSGGSNGSSSSSSSSSGNKGAGMPEDDSYYAKVAANWKVQPTTHRLIPGREATSPLFTCEGRQFALEMFADFASMTALRAYTQQQPEGSGVDVHIVISAGMSPQAHHIGMTVARPRGCLLICDTSTATSEADSRVAVFQVTERQGSVKASASAYDMNAKPTVKGNGVKPTNQNTVRFATGNPTGKKRVDRNHEVVVFGPLFPLPTTSLIENLTILSSQSAPSTKADPAFAKP